MNAKIVSLLRDPETGDALEIDDAGLRNTLTGQVYPLRDGIPLFIDSVTGLNRKYQTMYDRLSYGYDLAEAIYRRFARKPDYRLAYVPEFEVEPGIRVLEVSVGTGANLRYLPLEVEFFGLDLSWGMLRKCARNLQRWGRSAELFQCEGEHLPFRDNIFECVFHVGGINFFSDPAAAIREMIRVAKAGTKIVIVDETEKIVREHYQRNPATAAFFEAGTESVRCPVDLVPSEMQEIHAREIYGGKLYCLSFRKPALLPVRPGESASAAKGE